MLGAASVLCGSQSVSVTLPVMGSPQPLRSLALDLNPTATNLSQNPPVSRGTCWQGLATQPASPLGSSNPCTPLQGCSERTDCMPHSYPCQVHEHGVPSRQALLRAGCSCQGPVSLTRGEARGLLHPLSLEGRAGSLACSTSRRPA